MVLHQDKKDVITSFGSAVPKKFSIAANAKSFKILSDSLYKDKIVAIIRELSTNALDSHIAAGKKEEPFFVFLPTKLDPHFEIRDYGIGLNEEDVLNLYSTYFESDKDQSNESIGAFGLGSKTPFSYVSSFTVTSWFDGQKKIYTAYIDEDKVPNIVKVHEEDSEESNGLSVSFSVRPIDIDSFYEKASKVYRPFAVRPTFNDPHFIVEEYNKEQEGENYFFVNRTGYHYSSTSAIKVIYGNIEYPVEFTAINQDEEIRKFLRAIPSKKILYISVELGELDVALSREELSYDNQTVENLIKLIKDVAEDFTSKINKKIHSQKNFWKARKIFHENMEFRDFLNKYYKGLNLVKPFEIKQTSKISAYRAVNQSWKWVASRPDRKKMAYYLNQSTTEYIFFKYSSMTKSKAERIVKRYALINKKENQEYVLVHDFSVFGKYDTPKCASVENLPEEYKTIEKTSISSATRKTRIYVNTSKYFDGDDFVYNSMEELEKDKNSLVLFPVYNSDVYLNKECTNLVFLESRFDYFKEIEEFRDFKFYFVHYSELKKKRFQPFLERVFDQKPYKELLEVLKDNKEFIDHLNFLNTKKSYSTTLDVRYDEKEVVEKLYQHKDELLSPHKETIEEFHAFLANNNYNSNRAVEMVYNLLYRVDSEVFTEFVKKNVNTSVIIKNIPLEIKNFINEEFPLLGTLRFYKVETESVIDYINAMTEYKKKELEEAV